MAYLRSERKTSDNSKINAIFKRRALFGNQTVVNLTNIEGKRTVVQVIPSFKNFVYP
jgi:hypothetical protein